MPTRRTEGQTVLITGENMRAKHHAEVLIMKSDPDGPGGAGNYFNSLGVVDDVPDADLDARFRALDPDALRKEHGGDAIRYNGPRRFLADRFTPEAFDEGTMTSVGSLSTVLSASTPSADAPADGAEGNWLLTSPTAGWFLILRMYRPGSSVLQGAWRCPAVHRVDVDAGAAAR